MRFNEGQFACRRVSAKYCQCFIGAACGIEVFAIRTDRHSDCTIQSVDAFNAVLLKIDEAGRTCRRISAERRHRVISISRGVNVLAIGTDGDRTSGF